MVPIDYFDAAAELNPSRVALIDEGISLTYEQLTRASWQIAGIVVQFANAADTAVPIVLYSPNDYRVLLGMLGIMRAGGAIVPLHAGNNFETSCHFLQEVQPRCVLYHSSLQSEVERLRAAVPSVALAVCLDANHAGSLSLDAILAEPPKPVPDWIDTSGNRNRPVYYWATSGTSGWPKAVIEDCGCFDVAMRSARQRRWRAGTVNTSMALTPLSHGGGPSAFATLALGGTVVVMRAFDPRAVLDKIQRYRVTDLWLSPTAMTLLLEYPNLADYDVSSLRAALLGTAGVPVEKLRLAVQRLGPCIYHSYGLIETGFNTVFEADALAACVRGDHPERLKSSGRTTDINRIAIMSKEGQLLPRGAEGEIVVRGACVKRYVNAALTVEARRFGWHHTGDLGLLDEDGFLYVTGRLKDVVNMAGFKVAAAEVERTIHELAAIRECAVVSAPDPVRGEVIRAVVVVTPGQIIDNSVIVAHCRTRLGQGKTPVVVEQWDDLPRTAAGKVDKHRIRAAWPVSGVGGA